MKGRHGLCLGPLQRRRTLLLIPLLMPLLVLPAACRSGDDGESTRAAVAGDPPDGVPDRPAGDDDGWAAAREQMVRTTIAARGVRDSLVLHAMRSVPRHLFVPERFRLRAYEDYPLAIGAGQTISQPYIVALMTELLRLAPGDRVLEIGTGSGYQAAVLAELTGEVFTIEIIESLAIQATQLLDGLGYDGVRTRVGDGYRGWPEAAPFDAIIVTAAPDHVPEPLVEQLAPGGRLVIPVGAGTQELMRITREADGSLSEERVLPVRFVPMTGEAEER